MIFVSLIRVDLKPEMMGETMSARTAKTRLPAKIASVLFVGPPSVALDRRLSLLQSCGFAVTHAESICHAEMYSEAQYFDAAVYDETLTEVEQVSLARVMRVCWPWMRLIRRGSEPIRITGDSLFDAMDASEAALPETVLRCL